MSEPHLTCFPVIVVRYGEPGRTHVPMEAAREVFAAPSGAHHQVRFDTARGSLDIWVSDGPHITEARVLFEVSLVYARLVSLSDSMVTFQGVETPSLGRLGRPAEVVLTHTASGWT